MFSQEVDEVLSFEEYVNQFCLPPEPKPEPQVMKAGFPLLGWLLIGGLVLGLMLKTKNRRE
ncbi:MAG: hypothetical protein K6T87_15970 [Roseiflexus sp.]|uniref:hypothetical protein n=1 Tax=Roseiflexus sp. TaxID=2562120 RepID=UPI0025CC0AD1|nr:hypothetical protein [Roseiflexus sp.]MCL6542053.1 hypothetical protein [Roseiflexus sp.]